MVRNTALVVLGWLILAGYCYQQQDIDALWLWVSLSLPFGLLLLFAWRSGYVVPLLFAALAFLSHAVQPPLFFIYQREFGAIKDFDFSLERFFSIYQYVLFYVFVTVVATILLNRIVFRRKTQQLSPHASIKYPGQRQLLSLGLVRGTLFSQLKFTFLLTALIVPAALLNVWMYNNNVAITGVESTYLPFRLTGILYYSSRFFLPVVLFFIYMRTSRSWFPASLLLLYAFWAGISQVSRTTITTLALPVLVFVVIERRWLMGLAASLFFLTAYQWVGQARAFVYYVSNGASHASLDRSLSDLIQITVSTNGIQSIFEGLFSLLYRIGGARDVVLAFHYNTASMGGSWNAFWNFFLARPVSDEYMTALFGMLFPRGFAEAIQFSANIILIADKNWVALFVVSLWVAIYLTLGELLARSYITSTHLPIVGYVVSGLYVIFLYALGTMGWFYRFIAVIVGFLFVLRLGRSLLRQQHLSHATIDFSTFMPDPRRRLGSSNTADIQK